MKSVRIIDDARTVGLRAAYRRQGDFGTQGDWESLISSSTREVDIMGRTTHGWTRSREVADLIERKIIRDGVVFRWLIMATDNKYLQLLTEEDINIGAMLKEKLTHVANFLQSIQSRLPKDKRELLQIRVFSHVPLYCGTVRVDDQIYVTPYLFSRSSDSSPLLVLEGRESAWVKTYVTEFELESTCDSSPGAV
jgi:hypothetical protein